MKTKPQFLPLPLGFKASGVHAGLKKAGKLDMGFVFSDRPAAWAGLVTKSAVKSAPSHRTEQLLKAKKPLRAVVVNTKFANGYTGKQGRKDTEDTAKWAAKRLGISSNQVLVHSTGVLGVLLPRPKIERGVKLGTAALSSLKGADFAQAILTTDLTLKTATRTLLIGKGAVQITGFAKGSGMIHPNMATMLAYILTDAAIPRPLLDKAVKAAANKSFNRITVDGDTSPSDSLIVMANGAANALPIKAGVDYKAFCHVLESVCLELAQKVVRDGEGATKFVTIEVKGAKTGDDALKAAKAIAHSPLVKTALFGADPNWGRIMTALGYSGAKVDEFKTQIAIGGYLLFKGEPRKGWSRAKLKAILQKPEIGIVVDLGLGKAKETVYTCDLTDGYIDINGRYTT